LNSHYLYLSINFFSILFPFLFSFYPKANFSKKWKYLWISTLIPGTIFIIWDEFFTQLGVWGFNTDYLTGLYIGNLPIEEILFFICIPYACVFTYEALNYLLPRDYLKPYEKTISIVLILALLFTGFLYHDRWYTATTFFSMAAFLIVIQFFVKAQFISRFYFTYIFILIPFFIVNGILTGSGIDEPVVWYNNDENLGIRMLTIPVEDTFYGMLLLMMNVFIFENLQGKRALRH
jgi:lycopene cyclase domain-containing protein